MEVVTRVPSAGAVFLEVADRLVKVLERGEIPAPVMQEILDAIHPQPGSPTSPAVMQLNGTN